MNPIALSLKYATRHWVQFGSLTRRKAAGLLARERWPIERRAPIIDRYLRESLLAAADSIPAYRHLRGHVPERDLKEFVCQAAPIVTKDDLKHAPLRYYSNGNRPKAWWSVGKTSGTSGSPLIIYRNLRCILWEHAVLYQHWNWAGFRPGQRQIVLRGDHVVPLDRSTPPFWFHDRTSNSLFVSTRHLTPENTYAIAQAICDFGARTLRAYPSAAYELARLAEELNLVVRFDSIITGSEPLYAMQREMICERFGGRAYAGYGMAERVAYAAECEYGRMHLNPEYGYVEIVDTQGRPTDGEGFVVGTTFHNRAMPLIRYQLEDTARWDPKACPCGRSYPVIQELYGRAGDQLFDLKGLPVNPTVLTFPFKDVVGIRRGQIAQTDRHQWVVRVVPDARYSDATRVHLLGNFHRLVSQNLNISIELVENIPSLPNGKFKWVTQEWNDAR